MSKILLFFLLNLCVARDINVLHLNDANFGRQKALNRHLLVMFFIPWCGTCQRMRPHFAQAADFCKNNQIPVSLGKIDCSGLGKSTCQTIGIQHYPTFKYYQNGQYVMDYVGSKDSKSVVKFVRVRVYPEPEELKSVDEFKIFLKKQDEVVVVGFFEDETKLQKMFFKVAQDMKEQIIFGYSKCEKLLMKQGVFDGIVLFSPEYFHNKYEDERILYTGRPIIGEIKLFIMRNYHGLVGQRTPLNRRYFYTPIVILYYAVHFNNDGKELNYWKTRIIKIAHEYRNQVNFAVSSADDFAEELSNFGIEHVPDMNPFVIATDLEYKRYIMESNFSTDTFRQFVKNFAHRKLTHHPLIERPPSLKHFEDGAVVVATKDNFNDTILTSLKDTLLYLYKDFDEDYKSVIHVLKEVAQLLKDEEIVVAKMNVTENRIGFVEGKEVPNIFWLAQNKKNLVLYKNGLSTENIIKFVAKMASKELDQYNRKDRPKDEL